MITITADFLDDNWSGILQGQVCPVRLLEWDDGDAYTEAILDSPATSTVLAAIVLEGAPTPDFPIILTLSSDPRSDGRASYQAPDGTRYRVAALRRSNDGPQTQQVSIPRLHDSLNSRRAALLETDVLADRSVCVVGLGTGGINIALELAKAGVGKLSLVDHDRLEVGNISRHQAGISFVGRRKVYAARDLLLETNPAATIDAYPFRADTDHHDQLRQIVTDSHLVVCATDSRPSKLFVNAICVQAARPAIFGGAFRRAFGGQILRVRPHDSACYHCFVMAMPDTEADREISSEDDASSIAYTDRPVPVEPGLALDVAPISTMAAKLALHELIRDVPSSLHVLDRDLEAGWYLWINRPEAGTEYASWPPLSESTDEMTVLRWYGIHLDADTGCPTCGDFGQALKEQYGVQGGTLGTPEPRPLPPAGHERSE